jgi:hypothetical protein
VTEAKAVHAALEVAGDIDRIGCELEHRPAGLGSGIGQQHADLAHRPFRHLLQDAQPLAALLGIVAQAGNALAAFLRRVA